MTTVITPFYLLHSILCCTKTNKPEINLGCVYGSFKLCADVSEEGGLILNLHHGTITFHSLHTRSQEGGEALLRIFLILRQETISYSEIQAVIEHVISTYGDSPILQQWLRHVLQSLSILSINFSVPVQSSGTHTDIIGMKLAGESLCGLALWHWEQDTRQLTFPGFFGSKGCKNCLEPQETYSPDTTPLIIQSPSTVGTGFSGKPIC